MPRLIAFLALTALAVTSCGGDSSSSSCPAFTACGGAVVGTWTTQSFCGGQVNGFEDCPTGSVDASNMQVSGTYTFNANMSYSITETYRGSMTMTFPMTCLKDAQSGKTLTCAQLEAFFGLFIAGGDSPISSFKCSGTTTCSCRATFSNQATSETGTYKTANNVLTTTSKTDDTNSYRYCAEATQLTLQGTDDMSGMMSSMGSGGAPSGAGTMVLTNK